MRFPARQEGVAAVGQAIGGVDASKVHPDGAEGPYLDAPSRLDTQAGSAPKGKKDPMGMPRTLPSLSQRDWAVPENAAASRALLAAGAHPGHAIAADVTSALLGSQPPRE